MSAGGASGAGPGQGPGATEGAPASAGAAATPPPDLAESLRQVGAAGRSGLGAASDAAKAFRSLVSADISLARSALGRTLAFAGFAIAFGASAWLLLMGTAIAVLRGSFGWSWTMAMLACAAVSLVAAAIAAWVASRYFEHTRLKATRRQLARLGIGELADLVPPPGSAQSTRQATENLPDHDAGGGPMTDGRGVPVTPP